MDKFTDQLNPWSGTWLSQARGAGAWECRAASMGACALIPSLSPLGWEWHKDNKTLIPSLHTFVCSQRSSLHTKTPSGSRSWGQKIPTDPAKVLGSEVSTARWPPVFIATSCKSCLAQELPLRKVLVGISCINGKNGGKLQQPGRDRIKVSGIGSFSLSLHIVLCFLLSSVGVQSCNSLPLPFPEQKSLFLIYLPKH